MGGVRGWRGVALGVVVGLGVGGGIAYAVTVIPPNSTDRYYACVSAAGVVRSGTMKLNVVPTSCPKASDVVHSWNAQGPQGLKGDTGPQGPAGPAAVLPTLRTVTLGPVGLPASGDYTYPGSVDVHDCQTVSVSTERTNNPPLAGVNLLQYGPGAAQPGDVIASGGGNGGGGATQTWNALDGFTYAPTPTIQVKLLGAGTNVLGTWLSCQTFGSYDLFASVDAVPTAHIVAGSPGVSVSASVVGTGVRYAVRFLRDVSACVYAVTPRSSNTTVLTTPTPGNPNGVDVTLTEADTVQLPTAFDLVVTC